MSIFRRMLKRMAIVYGAAGVGYLSFPYWPERQWKYDVLAVVRSRTQLVIASTVVLRSVLDFKWNVEPLTDSDAYRPALREFHVRTAERIHNLCTRSKGIYIKFGQYLSTMDRVIPKEVADVLKKLQDQVPPHKLAAVEVVLDKTLPFWRYSVLSIDEEPVGSASLAQVHRAVLVDGTPVAIKIQYPELSVQFDMDLWSLESLARTAKRFMRAFGVTPLNIDEILNKFKSSIRNEMDFMAEMRNAEATKRALAGSTNVFIPSFHHELCGTRVLTMDFVSGVRIDDTEAIRDQLKLDPKEVGSILVDLYLKMIFDSGRIHCDPHPGNILVRPNPFLPTRPQIILLDHGFYRHLTPEVQSKFEELWVAMTTKDDNRIRQISKWFGIEKKANYLSLIFLFQTKNTRRLGESFSQAEIDRLRAQEILSMVNVSEMLDEFPDDFLMIIRTMNMIAMRNVALGNTQRDRLLKTSRKVYQKYYGRFLWLFAWGWFRTKLWVFENMNSLAQKFQRTENNMLL